MRRFLLAALLATCATSAMAAPPALRLDVATGAATRSATLPATEVAMAAPMRPVPQGPIARRPAEGRQVAEGAVGAE